MSGPRRAGVDIILHFRYPNSTIPLYPGLDALTTVVEVAMARGTVAPPGQTKSDVERLHELGYAQELLRRMGGFSNFAVSFTIISILSGCLTLYGYGMNTGGPVVMTIGWPIVGVLVIIVGLAMAEICSSFPTAGGLYYWSAKLAGDNAPVWSWFTGWFNLLGQVAVTAGIDFGLAFFTTAELNLLFGYATDQLHVLFIFAVVLV